MQETLTEIDTNMIPKHSFTLQHANQKKFKMVPRVRGMMRITIGQDVSSKLFYVFHENFLCIMLLNLQAHLYPFQELLLERGFYV